MPTCASGGSGGERSVPGGFDVVTGAFSYSGAAIARDLLAAGRRVRTVTGHPGRAVSGTPIEVRPLDFADPAGLTSSLRGAGTLYNTYWVRFPKGPVDHRTAVANSRTLFHAARDAGVARIVHVSITHPCAVCRSSPSAAPAPTASGLCTLTTSPGCAWRQGHRPRPTLSTRWDPNGPHSTNWSAS